MKKLFLIPLMTLMCSVMAFANVAQITFSDEREAVDCADLAALKTAVAALPTDGTVATIKLLDDINAGNLGAGVNVIKTLKDQVVILDLNGHNIKGKLTAETGRIIFNDNGNLTIDDTSDGEPGVIENTNTAIHDFWRTIYSRTNSSLYSTPCDVLHLKRCKVIAGCGTPLCVWGGELIIEDGVELLAKQAFRVGGGTGSNNSPAIDVCGNYGQVVTINGGIITSLGQAAICITKSTAPRVTINGGTFTSNENVGIFNGYASANTISVKGGLFSADPKTFVDQTSYVIEVNEGKYEVKPLSSFENITVFTVEEMKNAFESIEEGHPLCVTMGSAAEDFVLEQEVELPHGSVFVIPAGKNLTVKTGGLFVNEGTTICNGTINVLGDGFFSKPHSVVGTGSISGYESALTIHDNGYIRYDVSNAMQLQFLSVINKNWAYVDTLNLLTDINLPNVNFEMINYAPAVFDGHNHVINNLKMSSTADDLAMFRIVSGAHITNTVINADIETKTAYAAILARQISGNSIIENVTLNGSVRALGAGYGLSAFASGLNPTSGKHVWFVNCTNNANITTTSGYNIGAFVGTMTGTAGELGLYNCVNNGVISGHNNVSIVVGYGSGNDANTGVGVDLEFIAFANNGSYSETSPVTGVSTQNGIKVVGAHSIKSLIEAEIDPEIWTAVFNGERYIGKLAGVLDNKTDGEGTDALTTDWALSSTWTNNEYDPVIPNESDAVTVNNTNGVVVSENTEAVAKQVTVAAAKTLTIEDGGSLTIGENGLTIEADAIVKVEKGATLVIGGTTVGGDKGGITIQGEGEHAGKLIVEATQADGTGVVLVDPEAPLASTRVDAEVELIPDAHKDGSKYVYRYFGIPLYFEPGQEFTAANWTKEPLQDGESTTTYFRPWVNGAWAGDLEHGLADLVPFKGYGISNESTHGVKYTFKGKLVGNGDETMNFVNGFNLFANSYTAPINIQTLLNGFSNDVKATIYMFQGKRLRSVSKADFAGYRTPRFTVIPSMQAFFVLMDDGTSAEEIVDYSEAVFNNSLPNSGLYAPQRQETPAFNRVHINIADENGENDEVYLIEAADFTSDFENGYDEVKYMNNGLNLFATTVYGRQTTEITNDINGTFIGVQGNGTYTLTFDELVGEEYQIRDLQTNAVVAMSEANTYTFTTNGTNDARFVVEPIAKMPTALDNVSDAKMFVNNNTLYISENNSNANVMIYAANGQLVLSAIAQPTISLNGLTNGVYTVRVANQTLKFVK